VIQNVHWLRDYDVENSNGVLQPFRELGWWQWMQVFLLQGSIFPSFNFPFLGTVYRPTHISLKASWGRVMFLEVFCHPPLTFIVTALGNQNITCAAVELVTLSPPSGQTCGEYLQPYITSSGGYLTVYNATSGCEFCPVATTEQFLESGFNISYAHRWRNVGILSAFILFNVSLSLLSFCFRNGRINTGE